MIRPSPEIASIVERWTTLIRTHKVADLPHFLSQNEALIYNGTADGESWRGQLVRDGISDHMAEVPDFIEEDVEIDAWENGHTGWANYKSTFSFPGTGASGVHRATGKDELVRHERRLGTALSHQDTGGCSPITQHDDCGRVSDLAFVYFCAHCGGASS